MEPFGIIGAIIVAHLVGDYCIQSDWMAQKKTSQWVPAILHGITYTLPFLLITLDPLALTIIAGTHIIIDRFRLAKYLVWAKNQLAPKSHRYPWKPKPPPIPAGKWIYNPALDTRKTKGEGITSGEISASGLEFVYDNPEDAHEIHDTSEDNNPNTGYKNSSPPFMAVWLMIIADNTIHLLIAIAAVLWLGQ